ncbi:uncharacterized protein LOC134806982 isoform X2 [Pan troglodytes]|uniref:uncharacterized protein LOC134806982 isoform X2 n=1 Tax=Pan troglodytes TaxID=9598 RepID=UPI003013F790
MIKDSEACWKPREGSMMQAPRAPHFQEKPETWIYPQACTAGRSCGGDRRARCVLPVTSCHLSPGRLPQQPGVFAKPGLELPGPAYPGGDGAVKGTGPSARHLGLRRQKPAVPVHAGPLPQHPHLRTPLPPRKKTPKSKGASTPAASTLPTANGARPARSGTALSGPDAPPNGPLQPGRPSLGGGVDFYDVAFKVMLVGDSGVGKTCLLVRFKDGAFLAGTFISTVGIDFRGLTLSPWLECSGDHGGLQPPTSGFKPS